MMPATQETAMMELPRNGRNDGMVESWLRRDLARRFDDVLREALPPDMVALLSELA